MSREDLGVFWGAFWGSEGFCILYGEQSNMIKKKLGQELKGPQPHSKHPTEVDILKFVVVLDRANPEKIS